MQPAAMRRALRPALRSSAHRTHSEAQWRASVSGELRGTEKQKHSATRSRLGSTQALSHSHSRQRHTLYRERSTNTHIDSLSQRETRA